MGEYIPKELRARVTAQARHRCGYCLTPELIVGMAMEIEHIVPKSLGGETEEDNLWLACSQCNKHKSNRIRAIDPQSKQIVLIFDPRHEDWHKHFAPTENKLKIIGLTGAGRATTAALKLNRPHLVNARHFWIKIGLYPPKD